jgi:hypothetical protein
MRIIRERFKQAAEKQGDLHLFIFHNHDFEEPHVFAGYGARNLKRLRDTRKAVDPDEVFQKLQPGYF